VGGRWRCVFAGTAGFFFTIVFEPRAPRRRARGPALIDRVKTHIDPMKWEAEVTPPPEPADPRQFSGWLRGWAERYPVSNATRPLSAEQRKKRLQNLSTQLPADYLELVSQCEGLTVNGCAILGLSEVYVVHLDDGDYYVLADFGGEGCLAVRSVSVDGTVYHFSYDGPGAINAGSSFRQAVEDLCSDGLEKSGSFRRRT